MISPRHIFVGVLVVSAHAVLLGSNGYFESRQGQMWRASVQTDPTIVAQIIDQSVQSEKLPAPQVKLAMVSFPVSAPQLVQFDEVPETRLAGATSFPRLPPFQSANALDFARRIGVGHNRPLFVVLSVQVGANGRAGEIDVIRSCGQAEGDAAAIDYARALRWIPGTFNNVPQAMRVVLPVTLSVPETSLSFRSEDASRGRGHGTEISWIHFRVAVASKSRRCPADLER